jgi:hypothetical protein
MKEQKKHSAIENCTTLTGAQFNVGNPSLQEKMLV